MKIQNKFPKFNEDKHNELLNQGWILIKEPKNILTSIIFSIPLMIILGLISWSIINIFSPINLNILQINEGRFSITINPIYILIIVIFIYIHEFIHLICIPNFLTSDKTFLGLTWFGGYAYTEEILSKNLYIMICFMPFLSISIFCVLALGLIGCLTPIIKFLCLMNAIASSVDFLNIILISTQVPNKSKIIMNGNSSYYKKII